MAYKTIPGYHITEEIYRGRKRIVYRGTRDIDKTSVILKTLSNEHLYNSDITSLRREYEIIKSLKQEYIVKALNFIDDSKCPVLILEDIGGKSLKSIIEVNEIDLITTLEIAIKLVLAVAILHENKIIHKDINPKNIIVNIETGELRLIDFGISSRFPREKANIGNPALLEGTLTYISPEQTGRMNRSVDYRTDFYSIGATIYEMLTGQLLFPTKDPMELVHAHIAREPISPSTANKDVPRGLSAVVMKMLAKTAEERYQSAFGILADLQTCLEQWKASKKIEDFTPGDFDIKNRFHIPQKLYGREDEIATLISGFERVLRGAKEMFLVCGYSGTGKSALIQEIHKSIASKGGFFISGKFNQLQQGVPYSAIASALSDIVKILLTEDEVNLAIWKDKLLSALSINGQVIIDVIPDVELIIGRQPAVEELESRLTKNRFNKTFLDFIEVFSQNSTVLVIFLDDIHWADTASLKLIEMMMTDPAIRNLYLLASFRDNEVTSVHPLLTTLELLREEKVVINQIKLSSLSFNYANRLIVETLSGKDEKVQDLTHLVLRKTNGNPFFLREFLKTLYNEELIYYDQESFQWKWDLPRIECSKITDNVVDLLVRRLKKLPESTQDALQLGACLGNHFDLYSLSIIYDHSPAETFLCLWQAVQEGLIEPTTKFEAQISGVEDQPVIDNPGNVIFKFLHDRVQEAAYSLINKSLRIIVHARIGKQLVDNLSKKEMGERLFEVVDHLNIGQVLLKNVNEKIELAKLNLVAGMKAKDATAYSAARQYFRAGLSCLPTDKWVKSYDLTLALHMLQAEAEYLDGEFETSEDLILIILKHARSNFERADAHYTLIQQYTIKMEYPKAIELGRQALAILGFELPDNELQTALDNEFATTKKNLDKRAINTLINLPKIIDPEKGLALKLLYSLGPAAFISNPQLRTIITLKMVNISLEYGNGPQSAFGYSLLGIFFCAILGDYQAGFEFGNLAMQLSDKVNNNGLKCRTTHVFIANINHWRRHIKTSRTYNDEGYQAGLATGEFQFASFHCFDRILGDYFQGLQLKEILKNIIEFLKVTKKTKNQYSTDILKAVLFTLFRLTQDGSPHEENNFGENIDLKTWETHRSLAAILIFQILQGQVLYHFGFFSDAIKLFSLSVDKLESMPGHFVLAERNFYHSLSLLRLMGTASPEEKILYWSEIETNQNSMKIWAKNCPQNFEHKFLLVSAEICSCGQSQWEASNLYELAIVAAGKQGFIQDEALAHELAGKFYLQNSREKLASIYMIEARNLYKRWGAITKVKDLEDSFPQFMHDSTFEPRDTIGVTLTHDLSLDTGTRILDFKTVIKAAQTISGEIVFEILVEKLIRIVIENAGAQKGFLILERDNELFVVAECSIKNEVKTVIKSIPLKTEEISDKLPISIINYARRTEQSVLVADARESSQFSTDLYVQKNRPVSILCMPILGKGKLIGIMYLENNLISDAFKPKGLEIIQILSSQSAISLQNAYLFEDLRKALLEVKLLKNQIEAENIYLQEEIKLEHNFEEIISKSKKFKKILGQVEQVATTDANVLILGESGTGKELIARAIHNISRRKDRAMVKVNCAALPATLIESELFGHEKGAFTGALARKIGRFELANGGSLFLDEIGDIPLELQPKLLRVLQEGEFERLGDSNTLKVDVRIIAATNVNLREAITKGAFREDLYYRLNVFPINIPPLRERKEDIPLLIRHFLQKYNMKFGKKIDIINEKVFNEFVNYSWPGNIRELENVIERAVILSPDKKLEIGDAIPKTSQRIIEKSVVTLADNERDYILKVLERTNWRISGAKGAAQILNIKNTTMVSRMKKLGIKRP